MGTGADDPGSSPAAVAGAKFFVAVEPEATERMIPIRPADLGRLLLADPRLSPAEKSLLDRLGRLLAALFHHEYHSWLVELKDLYAPLDPDSDCMDLNGGATLEHTQDLDERFLQTFEATLIRANYRPLGQAAIQAAIEAPNERGLTFLPDFDLFEHMKIYVRGNTFAERDVRNARTFFRRRQIQHDAYQRLIIALKFKAGMRKQLGPFVRDDVLYLRLFKDVPHVDMEMHLPEQGTRVKMRGVDKAQIASPLFFGLPTFAFKLFTATLISPLAMGAVMIAPVTAGLNSFFGFQRAKQRHLHHMIRNLYYLTLANNSSVVNAVIDSAEEEEFKEAILAYYFLWMNRDDPEPWDEARLDGVIEEFIKNQAGVEVDFEIPDALRKLERFGIVQRDLQGGLRAIPLEYALEILDERWDDAFGRQRRVEPPPTSAEDSPAFA